MLTCVYAQHMCAVLRKVREEYQMSSNWSYWWLWTVSPVGTRNRTCSSAWTASVLNIQDHLSSSIDFSLFTLYDMLHTCRHIHVFATYTFMEDTHLKVCAPFSLIAVGGLWGQGPAARYLLSFMLLELLANSVSSFYFKINIKKLNPQNHLFLQLLFLLSFCLFLWFAPFSNNWSQWG